MKEVVIMTVLAMSAGCGGKTAPKVAASAPKADTTKGNETSPQPQAAAPTAEVGIATFPGGQVAWGRSEPGDATLYVKLSRTDGCVTAQTGVEGSGALATQGSTVGWLELATGRFVAADTAVAPQKPFVEGYMTPKGFVPSMREITQ